MAKHYGATVIATALTGQARDSAGAVAPTTSSTPANPASPPRYYGLTGGAGADLVLESAGGATLGASLTAAKRVTGRSSSTAWPAAKAPVSNWELVYKYQVHVIGLNIGRADPGRIRRSSARSWASCSRSSPPGCSLPASPPCMNSATGQKALAGLEHTRFHRSASWP